MPLSDLPLELFAIAVIFAAGAAVFCAMMPDPLRYGRMERLAYCYPLGLTALGMPMFLFSYCGFHLNTIAVTLAVALALIAATMVRKVSLRKFFTALGESETARLSLNEFEWFLVVIILLCLGTRTLASMLAPLNDWDGVCIWGIKAKVLYFNTVKTTDYFSRPELAFSHPNYPLLWPFMYAWVCTVLGKWDDLGMLILNPVNLIVFTMLLYATLRKYVVRPVALSVTVIMASLPALLHYAECGQADVPLMLISGASLFCLFEWMSERRKDSLWLAAFLMGGALFTKQEGKILLIAQFCAGALSVWLGGPVAHRKKYFGQLVFYGAVAVIWALPWLLFECGITNYAWDFGGTGVSTFRWGEIPTLCKTIIANGLYFYNQVHLAKWDYLFPILLLGLLTQKTWRHHPWTGLLLVFILHAGAIGALFLVSRVELTMQAMEIAFERYTLVMLSPLWLLLAKCVNDAWLVWKKPASSVADESALTRAAGGRSGSQRASAR
jgi:hypothetical protein